MSLAINSNLMAANASRSLNSHFDALETSTRRLSSGLRITRSSDDAAGLAVRELMRAEISTLNQGIRNANDAISLIQTADGALSVIDEKLIRMKELAMQAATGTYNSDQRLIIDSEYTAMAKEITRIANATDFNGIHLLNGNLSGDAHDGSGATATGKLKIHFGTCNDSAEDYYYIQIGNATASALGVGSSISNLSNSEIESVNGITFLFEGSWTNALAYFIAAPASAQSTFATGSDVSVFVNGAFSELYVVGINSEGLKEALLYAPGAPLPTYIGASDIEVTEGIIHTVSTQQSAQEELDTINRAIISKDTIRAHLGALQNRLENTVNVLGIQAENLQAAESRISDVDVSREMTEFVRNQILTQAAVSMLSQANSLPRMALSLIG